MRGHTKDELLNSMRAKSEHVRHVGHDGAPEYGKRRDGLVMHQHPASVPNAARGMEHQATTPTLARGTGKPKRLGPIAIHAGFVSTSPRTGQLRFGADDADPASPLGGPPQGKRTVRAEINPGSRSRNLDSLASESAGTAAARAKAKGTEELHALGQAVLYEARLGSREGQHGLKIGALPPRVVEET